MKKITHLVSHGGELVAVFEDGSVASCKNIEELFKASQEEAEKTQ